MPTIKTSTNYHYKGLNFISLDQVKEHVENDLGKIIDSIGFSCIESRATISKVQLEILKAITAKESREKLIELLTVDFQIQGDSELTDYTQNIFDIEGI